MFYDEGYKYGQRYSGYLLALKDSSGVIVKIKGSSPSIEKRAEDALKLNVLDVFDEQFQFVKKGHLRD